MSDSRFLGLYWSLLLAIAFPVIELLAEMFSRGFGCYSQIMRSVLAAVCFVLLVHSWFMQHRCARTRWRLAFITLLLSLLALGPVWLGLNVLRYYAHPMNWNKWEMFQRICDLQFRVEQLAQVVGMGVVLWVIVDFARWARKRIRAQG